VDIEQALKPPDDDERQLPHTPTGERTHALTLLPTDSLFDIPNAVQGEPHTYAHGIDFHTCTDSVIEDESEEQFGLASVHCSVYWAYISAGSVMIRVVALCSGWIDGTSVVANRVHGQRRSHNIRECMVVRMVEKRSCVRACPHVRGCRTPTVQSMTQHTWLTR
jgi:hypothetical protein